MSTENKPKMTLEEYVWRWGSIKPVSRMVKETGRTREEIQIAYDKALEAHKGERREIHKRAPHAARRWTPDEVEELLDLHRSGWTYEQLGEYFGRTANGVRDKVSYTLSFAANKWKKSEIEQLVEMRDNGATWKQIARTLGKSEGSVVQKWRRVKGLDV